MEALQKLMWDVSNKVVGHTAWDTGAKVVLSLWTLGLLEQMAGGSVHREIWLLEASPEQVKL